MQAATDKGAVRRLGVLGWKVEENMREVHYTTEGLVEEVKKEAVGGEEDGCFEVVAGVLEVLSKLDSLL